MLKNFPSSYSCVHGLFSRTHVPVALTPEEILRVVHYKPDVALKGSRRLRLLDRLDILYYEGGKVVTLTHRPSLPPGVFLILIFRG
jgi:hypothetical protein